MAGLSSAFMRPRPLGVISLRGLGYQFSPGVYSYFLSGAGGGGAGGRGTSFVNAWAGYGSSGSRGQLSIGSIYLRTSPSLTAGIGGGGGPFIDSAADSPGGNGGASSISSVGGQSITCDGGYGGSTSAASSFQQGYYARDSRVNPSSYSGRGWGLEAWYLISTDGDGGSPANSPESDNGSGGGWGDEGIATISARVG